MKRPAVFLDRDGTLNIEKGYLRYLEDLVLIDGAAKSVRRLNNAGIAAILVTNQSGAARNYYPESHIQDLHKRLAILLKKEENAYLDAIYYCPHLPDGINPDLSMICDCRKPLTGLIERAYVEYPNLDRKKSFMVGDKEADFGLAVNLGIPSILVETGYGKETLQTLRKRNTLPSYIAKDISAAIDWILENLA